MSIQLLENLRLTFRTLASAVSGTFTGKTSAYLQGDLRHSPESAVELIDALQRTGGVRVSRPSMLAIGNNFELVVPALSEAIAGNAEAKKFYESSRYIQAAALPRWAQALIQAEVERAFFSFKPSEHISTASREGKKRLNSLTERAREDCRSQGEAVDKVTILGLNALSTYTLFKDFCERADKLFFRSTIELKLARSGLRKLVNDVCYFSIGNKGPLGRHAATTLRHIVPTMLSARIASDYIRLLDVELPDGLFQEAVLNAPTSWKIFESKAGRALFETGRWLHARDPQNRPPALELGPLVPKIIRSKDPFQMLEQLYSSRTSQAATVTDKFHEQQMRQVLGFETALKIHHPTVENPGALARKLEKIQRRAACSYEEVVGMLATCKDPFDALEQIYDKYLRRTDTEGISSESSSLNAPVDTPLSDTGGKDLWQVDIRPGVRDLAKRLGEDAVRCFESRIFRVRNGNLGDNRHLKKGLIEVRIDSGPGYRLYIQRRDTSYTVLGFGTKKTQNKDIAASRKNMQ